jgi:hypothetical protein
MLVEIEKIVVRQKKVDGREVIEPISQKPVLITQIDSELIRLSEIRSVRRWNKSFEDEAEVEGHITMLYLIGDPNKKPIEVKINESFDSFKKRVPCVPIEK